MTTNALRTLGAVALASMLAACGGGSSDTSTTTTTTTTSSDAVTSPAASAAADANSSPAAAAANDAYTKAFLKLVAAEDNKFADLKGDKKGEDSGMALYASKAQLPGTQFCVVESESGVNYDMCVVGVKLTKDAAEKAFNDAKAKAAPAASAANLQGADGPTSAENVAAYIYKNDKQAVGIFQRKEKDGFTVAYMFGTPDDLAK